MSRNQRAETPLAHVIDELRREQLPPIEWDAVEDALMSKVGASPRLEKPHFATSFSLRWAVALAAICGVAAASMAIGGRPAEAPPVAAVIAAPAAVAASTSDKRDGHTLKVGDALTASADSLVVEHAGHVTWTLEKDSAAHLESVGDVVTVSLDRGVVSARVVKSLRTETFVVRVGDTRIAVHGTAFRVERLANGVNVRVTEGVLGIGPVGGPSFELRAPGAAVLDLAGGRTDAKKAPSSAAKRATAEAAPPDPVAPTSEAPALTAEVVPAPSVAPPVPAGPVTPSAALAVTNAAPPPAAAPLVSQAARAVQKCFSSSTVSSGDVHVSVLTKMRLRVATDGKLGDALFDPPLAPGVQSCVDAHVGAIHFPASPDGFVAAQSLELSH